MWRFFPRPDVMVINFPGIHNQQFSSRKEKNICEEYSAEA